MIEQSGKRGGGQMEREQAVTRMISTLVTRLL
jgi:hypothetical protein